MERRASLDFFLLAVVVESSELSVLSLPSVLSVLSVLSVVHRLPDFCHLYSARRRCRSIPFSRAFVQPPAETVALPEI